jgi:hypothetical protein
MHLFDQYFISYNNQKLGYFNQFVLTKKYWSKENASEILRQPIQMGYSDQSVFSTVYI